MRQGTREPSEPFVMGVSRTVCLEDSPQPGTLIADDQPDVREALWLLLKSHGHRIEAVGSPAAVLDALRARLMQAVLRHSGGQLKDDATLIVVGVE